MCVCRCVLLREHGSHNAVVVPVSYDHQLVHESRQEEQSSRLAQNGTTTYQGRRNGSGRPGGCRTNNLTSKIFYVRIISIFENVS